MAIDSWWPLLQDTIVNLPNRRNNVDYNLADDINELRQWIVTAEKLLGNLTYGGGLSVMFARAKTPPALRVEIGGGAVWFGHTKVEKFAGPYNSPFIVAPVTNPRIDVLTMDVAGTFAWVTGTENVTPVPPAYPFGLYYICEVYVPVGATRIVSTIEEIIGTDAYIINRRPIRSDAIAPGLGGPLVWIEGGSVLPQEAYYLFTGPLTSAADSPSEHATRIKITDVFHYASKTTNYTATTLDRYLEFDCTTGNKTLTLPACLDFDGHIMMILKRDPSANTLTILPDPTFGSDSINQALSYVLSGDKEAVIIFAKATEWQVIAKVSVGSGGGHIIQDNGTNKTARGHLDFIGFTVTDNAGADRTEITAPGGGGGGFSVLLNYAASTDLDNGTTIAAATWNNVLTSHSFTPANAGSTIEIRVGGNLDISRGAGDHIIETAIIIDGTTRYVIGGARGGGVATSELNAFTGAISILITGLSAAAHTVRVQVYSNNAASAYCRASSAPLLESYRCQIIEHLP